MSHVPSIEQLSPGSPFHVRQSPVHLYTPSTDKNMEPTVVNTSLIPFERDPEIYHKQLREKDNQIQMLQQYVEAMKKEFVHFRQGTKENLDPQVKAFEAGPERLDLHSQIYDLQI